MDTHTQKKKANGANPAPPVPTAQRAGAEGAPGGVGWVCAPLSLEEIPQKHPVCKGHVAGGGLSAPQHSVIGHATRRGWPGASKSILNPIPSLILSLQTHPQPYPNLLIILISNPQPPSPSLSPVPSLIPILVPNPQSPASIPLPKYQPCPKASGSPPGSALSTALTTTVKYFIICSNYPQIIKRWQPDPGRLAEGDRRHLGASAATRPQTTAVPPSRLRSQPRRARASGAALGELPSESSSSLFAEPFVLVFWDPDPPRWHSKSHH